MKLYTVIAHDWDYDQFDSIVILAENEERALEIAEMKHKDNYNKRYFESNQYPLTVVEEDMTKEQIILCSFNAG